MYDDILYEVDDPVATITLNRPQALNAWTAGMDGEIRDAVSRAVADRRVVGIVITGAGRGFCAGADMKLLSDLVDGESDGDRGDGDVAAGQPAWRDATGDLGGRLTYLMAVEKPVIAAVNGPVAGMGFPFVLACDLRVAAPEALFLTAFAQRGLIAEWGLGWMLPRLVGPSVTLDLLFSSRRVGADEALRLGLVNHVTEAGELLTYCRTYVEQLASSCSPASLAVMKRQVYAHLHRGLGAAEREAEELMIASFRRPDFAEGVRSFVEKRPPQFERLGE